MGRSPIKIIIFSSFRAARRVAAAPPVAPGIIHAWLFQRQVKLRDKALLEERSYAGGI
jgi:hypothetical protein